MDQKYCILIADDESLNYLFYREILDENIYDIIYAENGSEAIRLLVENHDKINLILMDIKMPVMDGVTATIEIRKFDSKIPIIAQTAYAYREDYQRALDAGCNDYIAKPIHEEELNKKIKSLLKIV